MELILNQAFEKETIGFDGFTFAGCVFRDCVIVVATAHFEFERCSFYQVKFLVHPAVPIQQFSHMLSQCVHEDVVCLWNDVYLDYESLDHIRANTMRILA